MDDIIKRYCPRIAFDSYEDMKEHFTIDVPEDFNFGFDVVDAWAEPVSYTHLIRLTALMISGSPLPESSALRGRATNTNSHAKCRWASRSPCALKQGYRRRRSPSMANQPARLPVNLFTTVPSGVKESKTPPFTCRPHALARNQMPCAQKSSGCALGRCRAIEAKKDWRNSVFYML